MLKLFAYLIAVLALAGCATVTLEAAVPGQSDCPATPLASAGGLSEFTGGDLDLAQLLVTPSIPFMSAPPSAEQFRLPGDVLQKARDTHRAQAAYDVLLRLVPYGEDLGNGQSTSSDSATAAKEFHTLLNELTPSIKAGEQLRLSLSTEGGSNRVIRSTIARVSTKDDINRRLSNIVQQGGDDALMLQAAAELAVKISDYVVVSDSPSSSEKSLRKAAVQEATANYQTARFLRTYFKAYFRAGKIFQSQLKVDDFTTKAMEEIKTQVKMDPKVEPSLELKLKEVLLTVCRSNGDAGCLLTSLGKEKLVTRSGESLQFKGVSLAIGYDARVQATWDYPKSAEFSPQLVRVLVEALFDSLHGRPDAVASSTACSVSPPLFGAAECVASDGQRAKVVAGVDEKASRADSLASVSTGQIIRGVSIAALNNEALARSAENLAGVLARKVVERAAWQQSGAGQCLTSSPALSVKVSKD